MIVQPVAAPTPVPLRGPQFGSYPPEDVSWLLTDLSHVPLEAGVEEREEAIQAGRAHYAASLPIEYEPSPAYRRLFRMALATAADRVAHDVGVLTELILHHRGEQTVLLSLARAGTPIGILVRRWAQERYGLALPHYAVSIVRGRGIDATAMRYVAEHHDPSKVIFIDGWTGKGAIARELAEAVTSLRRDTGITMNAELAVLADPGRCAPLYASRDDYLIPSACLNSTVSGLVSRTVVNDDLIGPGTFHGAKFYAHLAAKDNSARFLDAVTGRFRHVAAAVDRDWSTVAAEDRTPTWTGWATVEEISAAYGIHDVNLVKPGVGETTRVLLRRVPWRILARPDADQYLQHIYLLAAQRNVPVELVEDLPYSCVGLVRRRT